MFEKDMVSEIMNDGAVKLNNFNAEILKRKKPSKPPQKTIKKIVEDTKKLTPEKPINEETLTELNVKSPDINYEISEMIRYDVNWLFLRQKLLQFVRIFSYKRYEKWFNETFNKEQLPYKNSENVKLSFFGTLTNEDTKLKNELIEGLKPENDLPENWLNVNPDEMDNLLKNFPSLNPQNQQKPIEKITLMQMKTGEDFIDVLKSANNTKEQTREFLIQEIHRLEKESDLMKLSLLDLRE